MERLAQMNCVAVSKGAPPATEQEIAEYREGVPEWDIVERGGVQQLERTFKFKDFVQALAFTNQVGAVAEEQDHHPSIVTEWGKVTVTWWTHAVDGLHQNDFVAAAKVDQLYAAE
jgi:4a-hydroxytetrahydrobiopterin dehydratase